MRAVGPLLGQAGIDSRAVTLVTGLVELEGVVVLAAPRWMRFVWIGPVRAMTVRRRIYVVPEVLTGDPVVLGRLIVHELIHVRQWLESGSFRFLLRYVGDYLRGRISGRSHRDAYLAIRHEAEARAIAGD
jgi:hypothetical protein